MNMRPHILCIFVLSLSSAFVSDITQAGTVVLVEGDPPLTKETMQHDTLLAEWFLGRSFTDEERDQWKEVVTTYWPKRDKAERERIIKNDRDVATAYNRWSPYERDLNRAVYLNMVLNDLRSSNADPERWFLPKLEAAYWPGGERNPIVVPGDPPLTRLTLDKNLAMIEFAFALNLSAAERGEYEKLIQGWSQADRRNKERFIQDRESAISALAESKLDRGRLVTQWLTVLQTSTYPSDQWLLARYNKALNDPSSALRRRMASTKAATDKAIEQINNNTAEIIRAAGAYTAAKTYSDITTHALPALGEHLRK